MFVWRSPKILTFLTAVAGLSTVVSYLSSYKLYNGDGRLEHGGASSILCPPQLLGPGPRALHESFCEDLSNSNKMKSTPKLAAVKSVDHNNNNKRNEDELTEPEWTTIGTLGAALRRIAVNKTVIVCRASVSNRGLFLNFLVSLHKVGVADRLLVFARDVATWHFLERHWPGHVVAYHFPKRLTDTRPPSVLSKTIVERHNRQKGAGTIFSLRSAEILACLEHGYSVLYTDVDIVFLKNPFPYMVGGDFDGSLAWDGFIQLPWLNGSDHLPTRVEKESLNFCSCLLFLRPSPQSIELMHRWFRSRWALNTTYDNYAFNEVLNEVRGERDASFTFRILPQTMFPSGRVLREQLKEWRSLGGDAVTMHFNYFFGTANKIAALKRLNLWYLGDEYRVLNVSDDGFWPSSLLKAITESRVFADDMKKLSRTV